MYTIFSRYDNDLKKIFIGGTNSSIIDITDKAWLDAVENSINFTDGIIGYVKSVDDIFIQELWEDKPEGIIVNNAAELLATVKTISEGTILLAPGNYGKFGLNATSGVKNTGKITIKSLDSENPAKFSWFGLYKINNFTIDSVIFDYTFTKGDVDYTRNFNIEYCNNIEITNCLFDGDFAYGIGEASDGFGYAYGLFVRGVDDFKFTSNEMRNFLRGLLVTTGKNIEIFNNDIHSMRSDSMNFAAVSNVKIDSNWLHDQKTSPKSLDHADMIQFWTNGTTTPNTDITIINNVLDIGLGRATQSIFMRNEEVDNKRAGSEMFYKNVKIQDNLIVNGHSHGITIGETDGLYIADNTLVHADGELVDGVDSLIEYPSINVNKDCVNVIIKNNITRTISGYLAQPTWMLTNNLFVQDYDIQLPGWYNDIFVTSSMFPQNGEHYFYKKEDSYLGAGYEIIPGHFNIEQSINTIKAKGLEDNVNNSWNFSDGTIKIGNEVSHTYKSGGIYAVILNDNIYAKVVIEDPIALTYTAKDGFLAYDARLGVISIPVVRHSAEGLVLGGPKSSTSITREHIKDICFSKEIDLSFDIKATTANSQGEILRIHGTIIVGVDPLGNVSIRAFPKGKSEMRITTKDIKINDGNVHNIHIYMKNDNVLCIDINGQQKGKIFLPEVLGGLGSHGLTFGDPWGTNNFVGLLDNLEIAANKSLFQ